MKFYIDSKDKRNKFLMQLLNMKGGVALDFDENFSQITVNDIVVFAPNKKFAEEEIKKLPNNVNIFCGNVANNIIDIFNNKNITYYNIMADEEFVIKNANLTAEGTLAEMLEKSDKSLFESKVLILGNGKVALSCALLFNKLGLNFAICSYNKDTFYKDYLFTNNCIKGDNLNNKIGDFDIIVNTIPAKIIDDLLLKNIQRNAIFIELASIKCLNQEKVENFQYIVAGGLPQKYSAQTAGKLMLDVIMKNLPYK